MHLTVYNNLLTYLLTFLLSLSPVIFRGEVKAFVQ